MKFLFIILVLFPFMALAQPRNPSPLYGKDILGLAMQDAKMIAEKWQPGFGLGVLDGTFGDPVPNMKLIMATGHVSFFRAHLSNGPCQRNKNCAEGEIKPNDLQSLQRRIRKYRALADQFPDISCYLSPRLEHDERDKNLVEAWVALIRKEAPNCRVVISAYSGYVPDNVIVEKHGNDARGAVISNDGDSLFDSDSPKYRTQGTRLVLGWIPRFNLRVSGEKTFTPPRKRTAKATADNVRQVARLLLPEESMPRQGPCPGALPKSPELFKTNAEDYNNGDPRGDKGLLISKRRVPKFDILTADGRKLGCVKYYGTYPPNLYRHYIGSCSKEAPVELMREARSEWVYLKGGGTCYLVNAIRRKGYFR